MWSGMWLWKVHQSFWRWWYNLKLYFISLDLYTGIVYLFAAHAMHRSGQSETEIIIHSVGVGQKLIFQFPITLGSHLNNPFMSVLYRWIGTANITGTLQLCQHVFHDVQWRTSLSELVTRVFCPYPKKSTLLEEGRMWAFNHFNLQMDTLPTLLMTRSWSSLDTALSRTQILTIPIS